VWSAPQDSGYPRDQVTLRAGRFARLFAWQPVAELEPVTASRRKLATPAAGLTLFSLAGLPTTIHLPGGVSVDLAYEAVPAAYTLSATLGVGWLDSCLALRVVQGGEVLAVGRMQRPSIYVPALRLAAGWFVDDQGELRVYAHAGLTSTASPPTLEVSPQVTLADAEQRLRSPFGAGVSLVAAPSAADPIGLVTVDFPGGAGPAEAWFAHERPLEHTIPLLPDSVAITARERDRIAWGRHRAGVALAPLAWSLGELEVEGHPEWSLVPGRWVYHAGASRLWDRGQAAAVVPVDATRANLIADPADLQRLSAWIGRFEASAWDTGTLELTAEMGGWNEWRPTTWSAAGTFLWVAIERVDATNLGGIANQADAVEVTRFVVRWAAIAKPDPPTNAFGLAIPWNTSTGAVILSEADGLALLAGDEVTLSGSYLDGSYPTRQTVAIGGTLRLQAAG